MDAQEIWEMVRRAKLRLVLGNNAVARSKVDNNRRPNRKSMNSFGLQGTPDISYQTLPTIEKHSSNDQKLTDALLSRHKRGPNPANRLPLVAHNGVRDDDAITPINNTPVIDAPNDKGIPNDYEFEILRLRRRIQELESIVHDRNDRIVKALGTLEDELMFWKTGINDHCWESLGSILRRIGHLNI